MFYRLAADAVVLAHFAFILFVVFGALLVVRWPALKWLHLPAALWGVLIELGGWTCPLTRYETMLRGRAGAAGYGGGFVEHYVLGAISPAGLTRAIELVLAAAVVTINVALYIYAFSRHTATPRFDH